MIPVAIVTLRFLEVGSRQLAVGSRQLRLSPAWCELHSDQPAVDHFNIITREERIVLSEPTGS